MNDAASLWQIADREPPLLHADEATDWPVGLLSWCVAGGILSETVAPESLACAECRHDPECPVHVLLPPQALRPTALLTCNDCGTCEIPLDRLRCWRIEWPRLQETLFRNRGLTGLREEVIPGRLWSLGRMRFRGSTWHVWCGRRLGRRDATTLPGKVSLTRRSLVFAPSRVPDLEWPPGTASVRLQGVVRWAGDRLAWDDEQLDDILSQVVDPPDSAAPARSKPVPRRATRATDIGALVAELTEHLRAARSHALATLDQEGVARLLPRPSQKELAARLGISESRISRSLRDPAASQLKQLWKLAEDADALREAATRGRRSSRGDE